MRRIHIKPFMGILVVLLILSMGLTACSALDGVLNKVKTEIKSDSDSESIKVEELLKDTGNGVVITSVNADSPAEKAGLIKGDVLLMIGDQEVNSVDDVRTVLEDYREGDQVQLVLRRGTEAIVKTVEFGAGPNRAYLGAMLCCSGSLLNASDEKFLSGDIGAYIVDVVSDSPAEDAGLKKGDQIISIDDKELGVDTNLSEIIKDYEPGDKVVFEIVRDDERQDITVELGENPDEKGTTYLGIRYQMMAGNRLSMMLDENGRQFRNLPFQRMPNGGEWMNENARGIIVHSVEKDSPAVEAGLQEQDIITALDGEKVTAADIFAETIASHKPGDEVVLTVNRSDEEDALTIEVTLGENPDKEGAGYMGVSIGGFIKTITLGQDCDEDGNCTGPSFKFNSDNFEYPFRDDVDSEL